MVLLFFIESVDDIRIQYLKKNHMPFLVFGESQTSGVVYVSNNNFQATYDMMKAVTEENLKICGCLWEENPMLIRIVKEVCVLF